MNTFLLAWPYVVLGGFVVFKVLRGVTWCDVAGLAGAALALLLMTAALVVYPRVFSAVTGDHTPNIGAGLLLIGSAAYCFVFIWAGNRIGTRLGGLAQGRKP